MTPLMGRDQRLLPLLLIRGADWAKQVRDDARRALPEALDAADADGLIAGLYADPDDKLRAYAWSDLTRWLDCDAATTYQMPPPATRDRLDRLIDAAEPDIGTPKARLLRWHLGLAH